MLVPTIMSTIDKIFNDILELVSNKGMDRLYYQTLYAEIKRHMGPDCATIFANNVHNENGMFWFDNSEEVKKIWNRMMKNIAT